MRVFSTLMSWSNENKSCMRVDESRQARVCTRVFSTLMLPLYNCLVDIYFPRLDLLQLAAKTERQISIWPSRLLQTLRNVLR